jgi:hypothetical protein
MEGRISEMKKLLAVLLAVTMLFSVMAVGFVAFAEGEDAAVTDTAATGETQTTDDSAEQKSDMPDWLARLIERLTFVITKVLTKLGIKFALKTGAFA